MHAFLVISNNQKQTDEEIKKIIKVLEIKNSIPFSLKKVEDSKELKKIIKYSFSQKTVIILNDFDNATPEAVNSVLKNIEEPNQNLFYILTANSIDKVLPTIISRCEVVVTKEEKIKKETSKNVLDFINSNTTKRHDILNKIKERENAIEFVKELIFEDYKNNNLKNMNNYLLILKNLRLNGNVSLQLFNLLVRMIPATYGKQ